MAGHPPQEDLLALCPLTLGWWLYHLPAARGFSSSPLSMGPGRGTTSLAPHLHLEAKAVLRRALWFSYACKWLSAEEEIGEGWRCSLSGELAITCGCEGAVERASVVRAHAEAPLSMSV